MTNVKSRDILSHKHTRDPLRNMATRASVIIPCYNEGSRILPVVDEIRKSSCVEEILVVDDGSDRRTKAVLRGLEGIVLLTHSRNLGKARAVETGVLHSRSDLLLLVDGDLLFFRSAHVDTLVNTAIEGRYHMLLGKREKESPFMNRIGFAIAYTGERVLRKTVLLQHMEVFQGGGYLIEPALNRVFFGKYRVGKITLKGVGQVFKPRKNGITGVLEELRMYVDHLRFLGPGGLAYQLQYARRL